MITPFDVRSHVLPSLVWQLESAFERLVNDAQRKSERARSEWSASHPDATFDRSKVYSTTPSKPMRERLATGAVTPPSGSPAAAAPSSATVRSAAMAVSSIAAAARTAARLASPAPKLAPLQAASRLAAASQAYTARSREQIELNRQRQKALAGPLAQRASSAKPASSSKPAASSIRKVEPFASPAEPWVTHQLAPQSEIQQSLVSVDADSTSTAVTCAPEPVSTSLAELHAAPTAMPVDVRLAAPTPLETRVVRAASRSSVATSEASEGDGYLTADDGEAHEWNDE